MSYHLYQNILFNLQEYSVQITFRQKWNDDRLSYANRLAIGDMSSKYIDTQSLTSTKSKV